MKPRLQYASVAPDAFKALMGVEHYLSGCGLDPILKNLALLRASQLNHCAYCIDMHSKDLRALGETEQRLYLLNAWREAPFYSTRERAVLGWTEAVTILGPDYVPDEVYEEVRKEFTDADLVNLTLAIAMINAWNRLGVSFRAVAGSYQSHLKPPSAPLGTPHPGE